MKHEDDGGRNDSLLINTAERSNIFEQYDEARDEMRSWLVRTVRRMPDEMTVDEAGRYIKPIQLTGNLHEDVHLCCRFVMGIAARRVKKSVEHGNVTDALRDLANGFGLGTVQTLRTCINVAETFHDNPQLFARWLKTGVKKRWYHMIEAARAEVDPLSLGPEEFEAYVQSELNNAERTAERVADVADEIDDEETMREVEGVIVALTSEAERLRRKSREIYKRAQNEHESGTRDDMMQAALEAFEDMLRHMPCLACGTMPTDEKLTEPHHAAPSVTAKKQSHWFRAPLCYDCHMILEDNPHRVFKQRTGFDIRGLVARTLHIWITGHDQRFRADVN